MKEKNKYFFNTKFIGKKQIYFEELESTQQEAKKIAEKNIQNGTIIITDYQTNGIGTYDRTWYSEKNSNLTFSIIIYPKCTIKELKGFTLEIARCLQDAVENIYHIKLDIKEPNDIMHNGKKLGGILTQIVSKGEQIKYLLIGIGFNVNTEKFNKKIKNIATSLKQEFGREFSREEILNKFCIYLEKYCAEKNII